MHRPRLTLAVISVIALFAGLTPAARAAPQMLGGEVRPLFPPLKFEKLDLEDLQSTAGSIRGGAFGRITGIAQDAKGFLWIATQNGLARYDGARVVRLADVQRVTAIRIDASGVVWLGTEDAGLVAYDPKTARTERYRHDANAATSIAANAVTQMTLDGETLWVGLATGGVDRFDTAKRTFARVVSPDVAKGPITGLAVDANGNLVIASNGGGVMTLAKGATSPTPITTTANLPRDVTALLVDRGGTTWIGSASTGLHQLPRNGAAVVWQHKADDRQSLSDPRVTSLFEDRQHHIWVGTQHGLNEIVVDPAKPKLTRYAPDKEYPLPTATYPAFVSMAFEDRSGIMWFGTDDGLYKVEPLARAFRNYGTTSGFGIPMAFCEAPDGQLWAGTYADGLYAIDFANETFRTYTAFGETDSDAELRLDNWVTAVHCAADGTIWIAGSDLGLVKFQPAKKEYTHYPPDPTGAQGPLSERLEQILPGADGTLWLAGWGGGLMRFDPKTDSFTRLDDEVLPSAYLHRIQFDVADPQILWIGAAQGGLARLDLRTMGATLLRGPSPTVPAASVRLSSDSVLTLYQEPSGKLWIGTDGGGLNSYDPKTQAIAKFGLKEGLPSEVIYGILPDAKNHLWLLTSKNLVRFERQTHEVVSFTAADGIGLPEFNQNSAFSSKSGELYGSNLGGFIRFRPEAIVPDRAQMPIAFTGFQIFGKEVSLDRPIWDTPRIEVSYRDSVLTFELAALSYAAPELTRYQYKLRGFRDEWLTTDRSRLTFTNLDAGDYVLMVRPIGRHGAVDQPPAELAIHVQPPWWRSKFAYAGYAIAFVLLVLLVVNWQRQRLRRVERESRLALGEQDLVMTGVIQTGFLPAEDYIKSPQVEVAGRFKPAESCSGDWWWHTVHGNRHVVLVGDVTGHGAGPAMVTAAVATAFRVYEGQKVFDLQEALELLNFVVLRVGKGQYQMSLAAIELDESTGSWTSYNMGAPAIMVLQKGKYRPIFSPGTLLGSPPESFEVGTSSGKLQPNGRIMLFTDGIPEIQLLDGKQLGTRRLGQAFESMHTAPISDAATSIMKLAADSLGNQQQLDDWTFAIVAWGDTATE